VVLAADDVGHPGLAAGYEPMAVAALAVLTGSAEAVRPVSDLDELASLVDLAHASPLAVVSRLWWAKTGTGAPSAEKIWIWTAVLVTWSSPRMTSSRPRGAGRIGASALIPAR
jgi:hypothetical protein